MERRVRFATASTKSQELLRELGVDEPIDTRNKNSKRWSASRHRARPLGGETQERSWSVLKKGGVLVSRSNPRRTRRPKRSASGLHSRRPPERRSTRKDREDIDQATRAMIDRILPLSEVRRAHELSKSGHPHGKIALRINNGKGTRERKQS